MCLICHAYQSDLFQTVTQSSARTHVVIRVQLHRIITLLSRFSVHWHERMLPGTGLSRPLAVTNQRAHYLATTVILG